jgi:GTP-binding protein
MEKHKVIPAVCVVGRPNVGKSSLFNWLLGQRRAVVVEESGTTRDRVEAVTRIGNYAFKIVDTGGYVPATENEIYAAVKEQIYMALEEATVLVMVVDATQGITPLDREVCDIIRKYGKPVVLAVNKADNEKLAEASPEFFQLAFGEPVPISCLHRKGMEVLGPRIINEVKTELIEAGPEETRLKIAIVGRPNVGKSSILNSLLKEDRVIVSDVPGTTRDSIDTFLVYEGDEFILIDTAGIRNKRKVKNAVDSFSMMRSKEAIKRSDVTMLVLDASEGVTVDDLMILDFIEENLKGCVILINKWDLSGAAEGGILPADYEKELLYASPRLRHFPVLFVSAKTGKNVVKSLSMCKVLDANLDVRASTPFLNKLFEKHNPSKLPIPRSKRRPNFLYITQSWIRPVEFSIFVNDPKNVLPAHMSYIENLLRSNLPLKGIPFKLKIKTTRKEKEK